MAVDMTLEPWTRLAKLAPPGTNTGDLQTAADRYALTADLFAACADLWEEAAMMIDVSPDETTVTPTAERPIASVTQDGISVTYADEPLVGNSMSSRIAKQAQYMSKARYFRSKAKAKTPTMHDADYNPWLGTGKQCDYDQVIVVDEV